MALGIAEATVNVWTRPEIRDRRRGWQEFACRRRATASYCDPRFLTALSEGLRHKPYVIEATQDGQIVGILPLAFIRSLLFGRFLVSLPYLNTGGAVSDDPSVTAAMIDQAVQLADRLDVRYLELRHEVEVPHRALTQKLTDKVHMRLDLPATADELWQSFKPKVRNQIRKGEKHDLTVHWGTLDLFDSFYDVFSCNMRDLGTPVFSRRLFQAILVEFPRNAEICTVQRSGHPIAAALLVHGDGLTQVPSASSLREFNWTNANMLMYWHLLKRTILRGQNTFDFGRSSQESNTYRFKKQWGAEPSPAVWQYYVRSGSVGDMRPENDKYQRAVQVWRRLPVGLTRLIGPGIVRGIP